MVRRSTLVSQALDGWGRVRAEFELWRENSYAQAETECNGKPLNRRGIRAGIDPYSLFMGPEIRAYAYASEELVEHWLRYPRPVFEVFERQTAEENGAEYHDELERSRGIIRRARAELTADRPAAAMEILEEL